MIRILAVSAAALVALLSASCCCTSDSKPPKLRSLPQFKEIEQTQVEEIHYAK